MDSNEPKSTDQAPAPGDAPAPAKGGYGKRPLWQWLVIYLVVAVVVYGLIYVLFLHHSGTSSNSLY